MDGARYRVLHCQRSVPRSLRPTNSAETVVFTVESRNIGNAGINKARPTPTASTAPDEYLSFTPIPEQDSSESDCQHSYIARLWYVGYTKPNVRQSER